MNDLCFGEEFQDDFKCLSNAEVAHILQRVKIETETAENEMNQVFNAL